MKGSSPFWAAKTTDSSTFSTVPVIGGQERAARPDFSNGLVTFVRARFRAGYRSAWSSPSVRPTVAGLAGLEGADTTPPPNPSMG